MNVGTCHAAVLQVTKDGDVEIFDFAKPVADRQRIEKSLRGMFVRAIAGVDHGNIKMTSDEVGGPRGSVTHNETIGLHGVKRLHCIEKRLAFFQAGSFGLQIHGVRAETGGRRAETDARARGIFEESERYCFATKSGEFFEGVALDFLERFALIEKKSEFVRVERL